MCNFKQLSSVIDDVWFSWEQINYIPMAYFFAFFETFVYINDIFIYFACGVYVCTWRFGHRTTVLYPNWIDIAAMRQRAYRPLCLLNVQLAELLKYKSLYYEWCIHYLRLNASIIWYVWSVYWMRILMMTSGKECALEWAIQDNCRANNW